MKNVLVQYKGGGYDGCFWEWNYAVFDNKGQFHNIAATGYAGCKTQKQMDLFLKNKVLNKDFYLYKLNKKEIAEFIKETQDGHVLEVARWFNDNFPQFNELFNCNCEECGRPTAVAKMHNTSYHGAGGIAIAMTGKVCEDCYCSGDYDC